MNVNDLFPSRFVKAHDLGGKSVTVTIRDVTLEDVGHGADKESKLALAFEKATKMMLLNRTNAMIIASMYGPETDAWLGKAVTIYSARVKAFGAWHDALRVKEQIPARNVGAAKMPDAMQEEPPLDDEDDLLDVDEGQDGDAHNAPRTSQTPPTPSGGAVAQNGPPRQVDADTGEITGESNPFDDPTAKHESPPHQRLWGQGMAAFGKDWDMARPWLISKWTTHVTPADTRNSATELSNDEKDVLADYLKANTGKLQRIWPTQKAIILQSTGATA